MTGSIHYLVRDRYRQLNMYPMRYQQPVNQLHTALGLRVTRIKWNKVAQRRNSYYSLLCQTHKNKTIQKE